ncbi:MAG TPA: hypothetical protein VI072_03945 [Polyangiaceae bacterium]
MSRRHLPTLAASLVFQSPPLLEQARQRLGGPGRSEPGVGTFVVVSAAGAPSAPGVVLFVAGSELDVWTGRGRVVRTQRDRVTAFAGSAPRELTSIASAARLFASLVEGGRVRYLDAEGTAREGTLFEMCRYGALVARDDAHIMAVGFSKLRPASLC